MVGILLPDVRKRCSRCKDEKPIDSFYNYKNGIFGKHHRCKECTKSLPQRMTEESRQRMKSTAKQWYERNKHRTALRMRNTWLLRKYGISHKDYEQILEKQNGACAICGDTSPGRGDTFFSVDHDHKTMKVRGLLCDACNKGLGHFYDDTDRMQRAILYLERHG